MNDALWAALIAAGSAIAGTIVAQVGSARAARAQAVRTERQQGLQWRRDEAVRLQDLRDARLRELMGLILTTRWRAQDARARQEGKLASLAAPPGAAELPVAAAVQVYTIALLYFPMLREAAQQFYFKTLSIELAIQTKDMDPGASLIVTQEWVAAWSSLEKLVATYMDEAAREDQRLAV